MTRSRTTALAAATGQDDPVAAAARERRAARAALRAATQYERNPHYCDYELDDLRAAQSLLRDEISRVEYWRRVLRTKPGVGRLRHTADVDRMTQVLTEARRSPQRFTFLLVGQSDAVEIADLAAAWLLPTDPGDPVLEEARAQAVGRADLSLATYLAHLKEHVRLVTEETIVRYRENPRLALLVLPFVDDEPQLARTSG